MSTGKLDHRYIDKLCILHAYEPLLEELLVKVYIDKECWFISKDWSHYASFKKERAHRFIFRVFHPNVIIEGFEICHVCDRKGCINPDHLFKGNHAQNMLDAMIKGRVKSIKLPDKERIKEIRELRVKDNWKVIQWPPSWFKS